MGMRLFVKDGIFWPAENGVYPGDILNVILVAGGNRGIASTANDTLVGGYAGADSSFGSYAIAMASKGARGAMTAGRAVASNSSGAGGAGGFVPGAPFHGGPGFAAGPLTAQQAPSIASIGNGGGCRSSFLDILGGNGSSFGGGRGGQPTQQYGEGGAGYGAGGGAVGLTNTSQTSYGGNSGQILYYSHIITAADVENGIPITI